MRMPDADVLVFGTGAFAARIVFDLAACATRPTRVVVAGRNPERLGWLRIAGNARAAIFGREVSFLTRGVDLTIEHAAAETIAEARPSVIVQAASAQTSAVIRMQGNAWTRLVAEGGLSATAVFQAFLSSRVARAMQRAHPKAAFINASFPDVVNGVLAAMRLPVLCGVGNVAILATAFAGELALRGSGTLRMLAHYQNLAAWRRPPDQRCGTPPRVWIAAEEVTDVYRRFDSVRLTPEPAIEISGASGVPLMLALAAGEDWRGHVPGPAGLPGGYPVALHKGELRLDLPASLSPEDAVGWNRRFEEESGLVVGADGRAHYTGRLREMLREVSPDLATGFHVDDLEVVFRSMQEVRARLTLEP